MPGNERRAVREQPYYTLADLLRLAHPCNRFGGDEILLVHPAAIDHTRDHRGVDQPWADAIHADIFLRELEGCRFRQSHNTMLRRIVGGEPFDRDQSGGRSSVNDCATALLEHLRDLVLHAEPDALE